MSCDWISEMLQQNNIPNFSIQECMTLFGASTVHLHEYMLVTVGRIDESDDDQKQVSFLRILSNIEGHKPLQGAHQIQLYETPSDFSIFWVYSLSSLRHKLLHFTDYLSFERSTFLILPTKQKLIRLKCIRSIVQLPTTKPQKMHHLPILCGPEIALCSPARQVTTASTTASVKEKTITSRTQSQFKKHLEQIYTSYVRDLHDQVPNKKEILCILRRDIDLFLSLLETLIIH